MQTPWPPASRRRSSRTWAAWNACPSVEWWKRATSAACPSAPSRNSLLQGCPVSFVPEKLLGFLRDRPAACYRVALSGGLDSSGLLHALVALRSGLPGPLVAVHVDHGLNPKAAEWQQHCERLCRALDVPLESRKVSVRPGAGESL